MSSLAHFSGYVTRFLLIHQMLEWLSGFSVKGLA